MYCLHCILSDKIRPDDDNYGTMRPHWNNKYDRGEYRCLARSRGYSECPQPLIHENDLDAQVLEILSNLEIPEDVQGRITSSVSAKEKNAQAFKMIADIEERQAMLRQMNLDGDMDRNAFNEDYSELESRKAALVPFEVDDLEEAEDLLTNFVVYWEECEHLSPDREIRRARQALIGKIVDRIFVLDHDVVAISLRGEFGVILSKKTTLGETVRQKIRNEMKKDVSHSDTHVLNGSDGI